MRRRCAFHAALPDCNENKFMMVFRQMVIHSHLYGSAKFRSDDTGDALLCLVAGVDAIVDSVYKMNVLSNKNAAVFDGIKLVRI